MNITLEQARTFDAFARAGTLQATARAQRKAHTAVLYALNQLEAQTGLTLLDRTGYRSRLTAAGDEVLRHCRRLLEDERALLATCRELRSGWEPVVHVVVDAIVPLTPVFAWMRALKDAGAPTRVELVVDSLQGVVDRFTRREADVMITVLPTDDDDDAVARPLRQVRARLVAHRDHPLAKAKRLTPDDLASHVLLTVRGSDPRLQLPTSTLERQSTVHLSDFHAKKDAIVAGVGFGWLPDWLSAHELERGTLVALPLRPGGVHAFTPQLVHRPAAGRAARLFLQHTR